MEKYKRFEDESEEELIYRVCQDKDLIGTWEDVSKILNELLNYEYTSSKYRKQYTTFQKMFKAKEKDLTDFNDRVQELEEKTRRFEREKIKFRDERNAWQNQNYVDSRVEHKLDYLEEKLTELGKINFEGYDRPVITGDDEMVATLADLHTGQCFDSVFGKYNSDIAKERLGRYLASVKEYGKLFNISKIHIVCLGDEISGNIHKTIQVTNRENVIDQVKIATELISSFCYECCKEFHTVLFYSVSGNHSRIDTKKEALHDERLDDLIGWAVNLSLKDRTNNFAYLKHRNLDTGIVDMNVCGRIYLAVHGDNDAMTKQGVANLSMMLGYVPDGIYRGHLHSPAFNELNGVQVVQAGSLAGCGDDFTVEHRLTGSPSQTICIHDKKGIKVHIPVNLK